jgi:hypothetical protein
MKNHHHNGPVEPGANSRGVIHDTIAARAYELWDQSGRPDHQAEAFWLAAEREQVTGHRSPAFNPALPVTF